MSRQRTSSHVCFSSGVSRIKNTGRQERVEISQKTTIEISLTSVSLLTTPTEQVEKYLNAIIRSIEPEENERVHQRFMFPSLLLQVNICDDCWEWKWIVTFLTTFYSSVGHRQVLVFGRMFMKNLSCVSGREPFSLSSIKKIICYLVFLVSRKPTRLCVFFLTSHVFNIWVSTYFWPYSSSVIPRFLLPFVLNGTRFL